MDPSCIPCRASDLTVVFGVIFTILFVVCWCAWEVYRVRCVVLVLIHDSDLAKAQINLLKNEIVRVGGNPSYVPHRLRNQDPQSGISGRV